MKKLALLLVVLATLCLGSGRAFAEITISPEVNIQFLKLYEGSLYGEEFEIEQRARTYMLGTGLDWKDLSVRVKSGIIDSELEFDGEVEFINDTGMAVGADIEYMALKASNMGLSLIGSYLFTRTEVDEFKLIETGETAENPLRNSLTTHSYAAGAKLGTLNLPINPYLAVLYSDSITDLKTKVLDLDFAGAEASENFGLRLGAESKITDKLSAKIEGRLIDEAGLMIAGAYRF